MSFEDIYDMDTLEPVPEWDAIYRRVTAECIDLGIPLDPADTTTHRDMEKQQR